jgi:malate dehydrogenase (oxaloacetate-decarboxylating)(NADP+)
VREAIGIVRRRWPELDVDGEMQADTALDRNKMEANFPFCTLSQSANVLVFPDLTSGNIAYKLLVKLTDAEALGPLVLGIGGAVGIIPVGATVNEIVNIATYAAAQAPLPRGAVSRSELSAKSVPAGARAAAATSPQVTSANTRATSRPPR